jgi:hypothetical protein
MPFNTADSIAENIREEIEGLIKLVTGEGSETVTAYRMEKELWWRVLEVGRQLIQLFFAARSQKEERRAEVEPAGVVYGYHGQRQRGYVSLFGKVVIQRRAYWKRGAGSVFPLDEALSLPERQYSDCVQEMVGERSIEQTYEEAVDGLTKWLPIPQPKRSAQQIVDDHAEFVDSYYEQQTVPEAGPTDTILVVSADGKGIPMNRENSPPPEARRGKGDKKTAKKEATVTAVYTIAPYERSAEDIIQALANEKTKTSEKPRPVPTGKRVFGTLAGKDVAFEQLAQQAAKREDEQLVHHIALTDGCRALQLKVAAYLPDYTLILDIMHANHYLWKAANALLGETHPARQWWVQDAQRCLLTDDYQTLFDHLERQRARSDLAPSKRDTLTTVLNYLRRNLPYMDYQHYLAKGWPIGTGVVEGACRHLVEDRFGRAGMRWSVAGAQAMLNLRAVYLNGDETDFQQFRRFSAHQQRFGSVHPEAQRPNALAA